MNTKYKKIRQRTMEYEYKCLLCEKPFKSSWSTQVKFCSQRCRWTAYKRKQREKESKTKTLLQRLSQYIMNSKKG